MEHKLFGLLKAQLSGSPRGPRSIVLCSAVGVLFLVLQSSLAMSQNIEMPLSTGAVSCGMFSEAGRTGRDEATYLRLVSWVLGFIAAYDEYTDGGPVLSKGKPSFSITEWLDNYCQSHPTATLHAAANALAVSLEMDLLKSDQNCAFSIFCNRLQKD
jgi:hypothetical protein